MVRLSHLGVVVLGLLALPAQAQQRCQDLDAMPYQSAASPAALLDLLDRVASPAGWSVRSDGFGAWRGPMLRDDVPFRSAREAAVRFIRDTADAGWPVGGTIDAPNCVIRVSYHGEVPQVASQVPSKSGEVGQEAPLPALGEKMGDSQSFDVKPGSFLRETLHEWATRAGWSFFWGLGDDVDFRLEVGNSYPGDFKSAIYGFFGSLPANLRIRAELRLENSPPLLYVTRDEGVR
jgi:hypothetical protein